METTTTTGAKALETTPAGPGLGDKAAKHSEALSVVMLRYYDLIDQEKIDEVLSLFSKTATYRRCEQLYDGIAEIEDFYRNGRKIRGRHEIMSHWVSGQTGIVEGVFRGKGLNDSPKDVGFADFFTFDREGKICDRHTYLMIGSSYVKE